MTSVPVWDKITEYARSLSVSFSGDVKFDVPIIVPPVEVIPEPTNTKKGAKPKENQSSPKKASAKKEDVKKAPTPIPTIEEPPQPTSIETYLFAYLYNGKLHRSNILEKRQFSVSINHDIIISDLNEIVAFESKILDIIFVKVPKSTDDSKKKLTDKKSRQPSASTKKPPTQVTPQKAPPNKPTATTVSDVPKDQQIFEAILNEESNAEGIELLGSYKIDLSPYLFGTKRVTKTVHRMAPDEENKYISNLTIVASLKEHLLSTEALECMQPLAFKISAVRSLPNEPYLPEKCKNVYVTCKINNQVITTKEFPHNKDIEIKHDMILYLKRDVEQFRKQYEKEPFVVEVHDRDPKTGPVTYYGRAEFILTPLLDRREKELKLTSALQSVKCKPQPIVVPEVKEEEEKGKKKTDKKAPPSRDKKREKEEVKEPVPVPEPVAPTPTKVKEEIGKGAYIENGTNVKIQFLLSDYFPKPPAIKNGKIPIVIVARKPNVHVVELVEKFMEDYEPPQQEVVQPEVPQETKAPSRLKKVKPKSPTSSRPSSHGSTKKDFVFEDEDKKKKQVFSGIEICDGNIRVMIVESGEKETQDLLNVLENWIAEQHDNHREHNEGDELLDDHVDFVHIIHNAKYCNSNFLYRELIVEEAIQKMKREQQRQREAERLEKEALAKQQELEQQQAPVEPPKGKKAPPPKKKEEDKNNDAKDAEAEIDIKEEDLVLKPLRRYRFRLSFEDILLDKQLYLTDKEEADNTTSAEKNTLSPKRSPPTSARSQKTPIPSSASTPLPPPLKLSNTEILHVVSKIIHLTRTAYMKEVFENKLLPTVEAIRQLDLLYGDTRLIEQDRLDALEFYEQRAYRRRDELAQREHMARLQIEADEAMRRRMDTIEDLINHIGEEITISGIPLSDVPSPQHPRATNCIIQGEKEIAEKITNSSQSVDLRKYWAFVPNLGGHLIVAFANDRSALPPFSLVSKIDGILTTAESKSHEAIIFAVIVSAWQRDASSKVDTVLAPEFIRTTEPSTDYISANKERVKQLSETVASSKPPAPQSEPIDPNEDVYIYSGQKRRWTERQMQELRLMLKQNPNMKMTYSARFNSMGISPLSDDELRHEMQMRKLEKIHKVAKPKPVTPPPKEEHRRSVTPPKPAKVIIEKSNKRPFDVLCLNKPPSLFPPIHSHPSTYETSDLEHEEALKRQEAEEWRRKVVVDDVKFHVKRKPESNSDIDRLKGVLHDAPKKKTIKRDNIQDNPVSIIRSEPYVEINERTGAAKSPTKRSAVDTTVSRAEGRSFYSFNVQKDTLTPDLSHISQRKISAAHDGERNSDERIRHLYGKTNNVQ